MKLNPDACYRALMTRDARFDGRFFTGVRTTGIYCRPICPARTPKRENCIFFACAAAAQEAGFRPCLRCRPEASPGTPAWLGTSATVSRALRLIAEGALDTKGVDDLAARLGVGERHLRRLFLKHLGAAPVAVAQTQRILFAKQLIDETCLPMTDVALSSGFASVRRFNDAIRKTYRRPPRELRRSNGAARNGASVADITLKLPFRPPFDWHTIISFLAARAMPGVEVATPALYRRTVSIDGACGIVEVQPVHGQNHLLARIQLSSAAALIQIVERLRRIFDLAADPAAITAHLRRDPRLAAAVRGCPGMRVPGAWDGFELTVRAILGQQISVRGATTLAGRLVAAYGEPLHLNGATERDDLRFLFPQPGVLADADLTRIGLTRARAAAIASLARAVAQQEITLDSSRGLDDAVLELRALSGLGEWTAQYIALRALREPDAFPAGDLGLRRALGNGAGPVSATALSAAAEAWRPWRGYAAMYLWMQSKVVAPASSRVPTG